MEIQQLEDIIQKGENQEVEFKESFSRERAAKVICGFANTLGGLIILGVNKNKKIIGITGDFDELQQKISEANQMVHPTPLISIESYEIENKRVAVIIVQKTSDNAYYTHRGAIVVRVGSTTPILEGQTHLEFLRRKQLLSFDESYDPSVKIEDIDEEKIRSYLRALDKEEYLKTHSIENFLVTKKLASKNGDLKIKNPAVLIFGKDPNSFYPQNEIKLVKFSGTEPVDIAAHVLVQEDLFSAIDHALSFAKKYMSRKIEIKDKAKRKETYEYPIKVVREAIVNAVAHRDYFGKDAIQMYLFDDRLELTNPGSLPAALPEELFGTISVQRNPIIYHLLRDREYVEGLGTGISRMKNRMRKAGLKDPEFIFTESFFRIVLRNKSSRKKPVETAGDLNERQQAGLRYLKRHKSLKAKTYVKMNKVSIATAVKEINELVDFGFLKKIGKYKGVYYILAKS